MTIYEEIQAERDKQDKQWGGQEHDDRHTIWDWLSFIRDFIVKAYIGEPRRRLLQIAALAIAAVESLDRKEAAKNNAKPSSLSA